MTWFGGGICGTVNLYDPTGPYDCDSTLRRPVRPRIYRSGPTACRRAPPPQQPHLHPPPGITCLLPSLPQFTGFMPLATPLALPLCRAPPSRTCPLPACRFAPCRARTPPSPPPTLPLTFTAHLPPPGTVLGVPCHLPCNTVPDTNALPQHGPRCTCPSLLP